MVLDTKSKKSSKQRIVKIILVLLSCIVCSVGIISSLPAYNSYYLLDSKFLKVDSTLYDTNQFISQFNGEVDDAIYSARRNIKKANQELQLNEFVEGVMADYVEAQREFQQQGEDIIYERADDEDAFDSIGDSLYIDYNDKVYFKDDYYFDNVGNIYIRIPIDTDNEAAKEIIIAAYYKEAEHIIDIAPDSKTLSYYVEATDGTIVSNVDSKESIKNALNIDNGFSVIDEEAVEMNKLSAIHSRYSDSQYSNIKEAYFVLDTDFDNDDRYSAIKEFYSKINYQKVVKGLIVSLAMIVALIILFVLSLVMAGRVGEERLTSGIDKIPNDLHFLISTGLSAVCIMGCCLLVSGFCEINNSVVYDETTFRFFNLWTFKPLLATTVVGGYLFILDLFTSIARQVKAHKSLLKNTLVFIIIKWIVKLFKSLFTKIKEKGGYRLGAFKKQLIAFLVGYGIINLFLFFMICVCDREPKVFFALLLMALNVVSLVFVVKYVIALDKIIVAYHNRTIAPVDYKKLPKSLKALVDSQMIANQQLNTAIQKAVKDERMRTELITNVSHDLKTPLTSIITYVDLLKQCDIEDEKAMSYITVLDEKSERLKRLIDDLVEASKITSGVISLNLVQLDMKELTTQAIVEHQYEFEESELDLVFKESNNKVVAFADGSKTYRVIENLLSNAKKYSLKGTRVYVDVYESNNRAVFEIKNISAHPLDITPEELKERFVRGDKSRNKEGNGLGLSISDSLCKAMGGQLDLQIDGDLFKVKVILPKQ